MRPLMIVVATLFASSAMADINEKALKHEVTILFTKSIAGYTPGAVVRSEGEAQVKDINTATSVTELNLRLMLWALDVHLRPFMMNVSDTNGPKVVGLHYELLIRPFACVERKEAGWDIPWKDPCMAAGMLHRSAHNLDDGTFGYTYTNSLLTKLRLRSGDGGKHEIWIWGQIVMGSLESPFALTPATDIPASELEKRSWLVGASASFAVGPDGTLVSDIELRASAQGVAAIATQARYLHAFDIGISGSHALTLLVGGEAGMEYNFRKAELLGPSAYRLGLVVGLPIRN